MEKVEKIINLSRFKKIIEKNIYLDLEIEKYVLENYSSNLSKQSKIIKDIQIMILNNLNVKYEHHNEMMDYLSEIDFTSKIIRLLNVLNYLFLNAIGIHFSEINFKRYENEKELIVVMEVTK